MSLILVLLWLFGFLLFDNIAKRSLWLKSRLLWHFQYFQTFFACTSLYKSKNISCRFTDVWVTLQLLLVSCPITMITVMWCTVVPFLSILRGSFRFPLWWWFCRIGKRKQWLAFLLQARPTSTSEFDGVDLLLGMMLWFYIYVEMNSWLARIMRLFSRNSKLCQCRYWVSTVYNI